MALGGVPFGEQAARLHRHRAETLHREALAAGVRRVPERGFGVALLRRQRDDVIAAGRLEQQAFVLARGGAIRHRRQRLDVEADRVERVFGQRRAVGHHHGDRLADVAHLVAGDHRLLIRLELGQQLLPHGDDRDFAQVLAAMSFAVMTARTPGRFNAADVSIERMRPCATELRSNTACSASGLGTSSTNSPRPRRKRRSSRRSIGLPIGRFDGACAVTATRSSRRPPSPPRPTSRAARG